MSAEVQPLLAGTHQYDARQMLDLRARQRTAAGYIKASRISHKLTITGITGQRWESLALPYLF